MSISKTTHGCLWQLYSQLPNWKQSRCPSVDVNKQTVVHSDNGVLFSTKETCCQALKRHGGNLDNITAWNKPIWKAIQCMISKLPTLSQKWKGDKKKTNKKKKRERFVQDCGKKGMNSRKQNFYVSENYSVWFSNGWYVTYIVVKTHIRNIKSEI